MKFFITLLIALPGPFATADRGSIVECQNAILLGSSGERAAAIRSLPKLLTETFGDEIEREDWYQLLTDYVIPTLDGGPLLVTSLIGLGSSRKSAIFSAIESYLKGDSTYRLGSPLSPSRAQAGSTRRPIIAIGCSHTISKDDWSQNSPDFFLSPQYLDLNRRFRNCLEKIWFPSAWKEESDEAVTYVSRFIHENLAFVDTAGLAVETDDDERTASIVKSSDVLMLSTADGLGSLRNADYRRRLRDLFTKYGYRKIIVVVSGMDEGLEGEIREEVRQFANAIYGTQSPHMPDAVLGIYNMPHETKVQVEKAHPTLLPIMENSRKRYPTFDQLARLMNDDSGALKEWGVQRAMDLISTKVAERTQHRMRSALLAQLYQTALDHQHEAAAREIGFGFPAERIFDWVMRTSGFYTGDGRLARFLDAGVMRVTTSLMRRGEALWLEDQQQVIDDGNTRLHRANPNTALDVLLTPFKLSKEGKPAQLRCRADSTLVRHARAFAAATRGALSLAVLDSKLLVRKQNVEFAILTLPGSSGLPADVRAELEDLLARESSLASELGGFIDDEMKRVLDPAVDPANMYRNIPAGSKLGWSVWAGIQMGLSAFGISSCVWTSHKVIGPTVSTGGLIVAHKAKMSWLKSTVHKHVADKVRGHVQPLIEFRLNEILFQVRERLAEAATVTPFMEQLQDVLKVLRPSYRPLPTSLDDATVP